MFLDRFDRAAASTIVDALEASDAPLRAVQLRALGGAMARVPVEATAFAHRDRKILAQVVSFFVGPDDRPTRARWVADLATALQPGETGAYVNFLGDGSEGRVREAYPGPTWDRLVEVKTRYDPNNVFRGNFNVPPCVANERGSPGGMGSRSRRRLRAVVAGERLPERFERRRLALAPGVEQPADAAEWAGAIVLIEHGRLEVCCVAGTRSTYSQGDLLPLGWLPLLALRNPGAVGDPARGDPPSVGRSRLG